MKVHAVGPRFGRLTVQWGTVAPLLSVEGQATLLGKLPAEKSRPVHPGLTVMDSFRALEMADVDTVIVGDAATKKLKATSTSRRDGQTLAESILSVDGLDKTSPEGLSTLRHWPNQVAQGAFIAITQQWTRAKRALSGQTPRYVDNFPWPTTLNWVNREGLVVHQEMPSPKA